MSAEAWSEPRSWAELRGGGQETFTPDNATCSRIATTLDIESLGDLVATIGYEAWLDGAKINGHVKASAGRICGVSLDPFEENLDAEIEIRVVPEGSPHAPHETGEVVVSLEMEDPPDVAGAAGVDLAAYAVEALGLALDPFPRKAGAVFEYQPATREPSPFDVLARLSKGPDETT